MHRATWLVLAWRIAGYYGLDYFVLPRLGAPAGEAFKNAGRRIGRVFGNTGATPR